MSYLRKTRRPEWGSNPRPHDPESEVLTTRPPRTPVERFDRIHFILAGNDDMHKGLNELNYGVGCL